MTMAETAAFENIHQLTEMAEDLAAFVKRVATEGTAAHEVEREIWRRVLAIPFALPQKWPFCWWLVVLYYTENSPNEVGNRLVGRVKQIGVAVAESPLGPFVDKRTLANDAIDAHLFEDTDGKLYLYYVQLAGGFKIVVQPMQDPLTPQGEPTEVIRPTEPWEQVSGHVTEGPFMLKRGDTFYLMYSGTGADSPNYAIGYATAQSPIGPFTKYAGNPIAKRTESLLGPGHHSVVEGPDGDLWMLYHQKFDEGTNFRRDISLDRLWFDDQGILHAKVTRGTTEPSP